jgi:predicted dehydrogenase
MAVMFQQRTNPIFQEIRNIVHRRELGEIRRINWIVTDWFRTEGYYAASRWRGTWAGEGGGLLLNQCPHQLDLWQWIFGMPRRVRAFCGFGRYHRDIHCLDRRVARHQSPGDYRRARTTGLRRRAVAASAERLGNVGFFARGDRANGRAPVHYRKSRGP